MVCYPVIMNTYSLQSANIQLVLEQIIKICRAEDSITQVLLFGSRAKGTAMERSDIDIALIGHDIDIEKLRDDISRSMNTRYYAISDITGIDEFHFNLKCAVLNE